MKFERQCNECGLIFDLKYPVNPDSFLCWHCRPIVEARKPKSRAQIILERNKEKAVMI